MLLAATLLLRMLLRSRSIAAAHNVPLSVSILTPLPSATTEFLELLEHDKRKPKHTGFFISKVGGAAGHAGRGVCLALPGQLLLPLWEAASSLCGCCCCCVACRLLRTQRLPHLSCC